MSHRNEELRDLERAWEASGDLQDKHAWLAAKARREGDYLLQHALSGTLAPWTLYTLQGSRFVEIPNHRVQCYAAVARDELGRPTHLRVPVEAVDVPGGMLSPSWALLLEAASGLSIRSLIDYLREEVRHREGLRRPLILDPLLTLHGSGAAIPRTRLADEVLFEMLNGKRILGRCTKRVGEYFHQWEFARISYADSILGLAGRTQ